MTQDVTETQALVQLRGVLADLYSDTESIRRVAVDAGLKESQIAFSNQALDSWHAVLQEAKKRERVTELVSIALQEYKENQKLQNTWKIYRTAVQRETVKGISPSEAINVGSKRRYSILTQKATVGIALLVLALIVTAFYLVSQSYFKSLRDKQYQIALNWKGYGRPPLTGFDLVSRDLSHLDLSQADLSGANLAGAILTGTNLTGADLTGAILTGANLTGADLAATDLRKSKVDDTTQLDKKWRLVWEIVNEGRENRNLKGADLSRAILAGAILGDADLTGANLSEADLAGAILQGAILQGAILQRTNLQGADLRGAYLLGAILHESKIDDTTQLDKQWRLVWEIVNQRKENRDLRGANLLGANLMGADLTGADLTGAVLYKANLQYVNLRKAKIDDTTRLDDKWRLVWEIVNQGKWNRDLGKVDLSRADLTWADLGGAILTDADLTGADLGGAILTGADLRGADLHYTNLREADLAGARYDSQTTWPEGFRPPDTAIKVKDKK